MQNKGIQMLSLKKDRPRIMNGNWNTILEHIKKEFDGKTAGAFVVMHHGICMGSYVEGKFIMPKSLPLDPLYLQSIRVFDTDSECYIWRSSIDAPDIFRMRTIHDQEISNNNDEAEYIIEAQQLLWGTILQKCQEDPAWDILKEKRGTELLIHHLLLPENIEVTTDNRLWLITRNYIEYNKLGQAGYVDCRFVKIQNERGVRG